MAIFNMVEISEHQKTRDDQLWDRLTRRLRYRGSRRRRMALVRLRRWWSETNVQVAIEEAERG
jgi:hypothetical protein